MTLTVTQLIGAFKARQAEISYSLAVGNAATWEAYQRMVGEHNGLQKALEIIDNFLEDENEHD
ncbi:MAG: hypothetical protein EBS91_06110 [Betaproteobacteria bacterium]|jgi:hypothetical protein|nr:hypothetical protein [Betaproteobacteria bacterium]